MQARRPLTWPSDDRSRPPSRCGEPAGLGHAGFLLDEIHARVGDLRSRHCACARPICRSNRSWDPWPSRPRRAGEGGRGEAEGGAAGERRQAATELVRGGSGGWFMVRVPGGLTEDRTGAQDRVPALARRRASAADHADDHGGDEHREGQQIRDPGPNWRNAGSRAGCPPRVNGQRGVQQRAVRRRPGGRDFTPAQPGR